MINILATAEPFGYGPIVKCLNVLDALRKRMPVSLTFLGDGISLEQALRTDLFKNLIKCNVNSQEALSRFSKLFDEMDYIVSVENITGADFFIKQNKKVFFIDGLFWMWDEIPESLYDTYHYFISDMFGKLSYNLELIKRIRNVTIVGPLKVFDTRRKLISRVRKNQLLINLGGAQAFLINQKIINDYYGKILSLLLNSDIPTNRILICGGQTVISYLDKRFSSHEICAEYLSLENNKLLDYLCESKWVIATPGLGNFYESIYYSKNVFFLPPINYSQFWQLEMYRNLEGSHNYALINWNDFAFYSPIKWKIREVEGIQQVLKNVEAFIKSEKSDNIFINAINSFFKRQDIELSDDQIIKKIPFDGIDKMCDIITERISRDAHNIV